MTSTYVQADEAIAVPPESWERIAGMPAAWLAAHPVTAARWVRVRAVGLWVSLIWVLVLLLVVPDVRGSVRAYAGSFALVVVWFALARTKTISWATTARLFTASVAWSAVIGWFTLQVAGALDLWPSSDGPGIALAGFLEESGKLVPLMILVVVAPGRVRRFATVDWALVGFISGAAFNAYEDSLRQVAVQQSWLSWGNSEMAYTLNPWTSGRFVSSDGFAVSPGHHIWTAMTAMSIGVAVAWWRTGRRGSRVGAIVPPVAIVLLAIAEHAGFNAHNGTSTWPGQGGQGFSAALKALWAVTGHGRASTVVSVVLLVACLAVDVCRRHQAALLAPAVGGKVRPGGAVADTEPGLSTLAWWRGRTAPLTEARTPPCHPGIQAITRTLAATGTLVIWAGSQWWADVTVALSAHARAGAETRRDAASRGRAVTTRVRAIRAEAMMLTMPGTEPRARRRFALIGAIVGVLALVVCAVWGAHMASAIGSYLSTGTETHYLAGLLGRAGDWWNGLNGWQQVAVGAGIAAVVALSGGSLALAMGVSGAATYGLTKAHGAATFTRDPLAATTSYLTTTTPAEFLMDTGEFALTFAPGNFAGAAAGRGARLLTEEIARGPAAFWAARGTALTGDAGIIDPGAFLRREPIELADGTVLPSLSRFDEAAETARIETFIPRNGVHASGAARDYQVAVYGNAERIIPMADGTAVFPDGFTTAYGAVGDTKLVISSRSWNIPGSITNPTMRQLATDQMDRDLLRLSQASSMRGGSGTIEIATNNSAAAEHIEGRIRDLGLSGYVRIVEAGL